MRFRMARSLTLAFALILSVLGATAGAGNASAAHSGGILLFVKTIDRDTSPGHVEKIWVHTMALATVSLNVDYGNGQAVQQTGTTDSAGTYLFQWTVGYTGTAVTLARFWVHVTRGNLATA